MTEVTNKILLAIKHFKPEKDTYYIRLLKLDPEIIDALRVAYLCPVTKWFLIKGVDRIFIHPVKKLFKVPLIESKFAFIPVIYWNVAEYDLVKEINSMFENFFLIRHIPVRMVYINNILTAVEDNAESVPSS
jgi:hypothetical protein